MFMTYTGLDYHFYREEIYMTLESHYVTRISITLVNNTLKRTTGKFCIIVHVPTKVNEVALCSRSFGLYF